VRSDQQSGGGSNEERDILTRMVPYKNTHALVGYYLAVFSFIPFLGLALGLAAFVLGIIGLKRAAAEPEIKGRTHAWVAIIVGGLFGFGYLALVLLMMSDIILH